MTRATMEALAARCEANDVNDPFLDAEKIDRDLNHDVLVALGYTQRDGRVISPRGETLFRTPDFVGSRDDVASLLPARWCVTMTGGAGTFWRVFMESPDGDIVRAAAPGERRARLAAALRARAMVARDE